MKNILLPVFFSLAILPLASSQTYRQYINAAEEAMTQQNYYAAMKHFQEAFSIEGETPEALYKYAEAARQFNSFTYADTAYTKVLASEKAAEHPLASFWLATVKKRQGKYAEAQELFRRFAETNPDSYREGIDPEFFEKVNEEVKELDWAIAAIQKVDENISVEQLDNERINTPKSEVAAIQRGKDIWFTTQNSEQEVQEDGNNKKFAQVLQAEEGARRIQNTDLNEKGKHVANLVFNQKGTRVYYTICDYVGESTIVRCNLYYRPVNDKGEFGEKKAVGGGVNLPETTSTQPSVSFNEATGKEFLYFVSDRKGGKGGLDLWVSFLENDSTFSDPENLAALNTEGNEVSPFFHNVNHHLYFSSDGRQGFGSYDIYKAVKKTEGWGDVEHLPVPFNTSYNDWYFWMNEGQTKGFFASSRLGSHVLEPEFEACCDDLYAFTVQIVKLDLLTFNKKNLLPLDGVTVDLFEITPNGDLKLLTTTNPDGNDFHFDLKKGSKYVTLANKPGFLPIRDTIDLSDRKKNLETGTIERKIYLVPTAVDLHVTSFNKRTMNPLKDVEVRLVIDGQEVDYKKNPKANDVNFVLERGKSYQVIASKVAYFPDTTYVDLRSDVTTTDVHKKMLLRPKEIEDFPPLVIYFDNDQPNPRTRKTVTEFDYKETWQNYMARKDVFYGEYLKGRTGQDSSVAAKRIEAFFEREVNNGYLSLEVFSENIWQIMDDGGFKVELVIQGFTSPRADADYNFDLSERRSDCLKNHFETWNGGVLKPFIDQGMIVLQKVAYGEKVAPQYISDRLDDEKESIYGVGASFERKVAIIGARRVAGN